MKSEIKAFALIAAFLCVALLSQTFQPYAQSGRIVPPLPSQPESSVKPETAPEFVPDPNRDQFKLIVDSGYEDKLLATPKTKQEKKTLKKARELDSDRSESDYENNFMRQLNQAGAQGYKVVTVGWFPTIAIARRDSVQHEYATFRTISPFGFADAQFELKYEALARIGFRVIACLRLWGDCVSDGDYGDRCDYQRQYIVEREKGVQTRKKYEAVYQHHGIREKKTEAGLVELLNSALASGLYPTHIITNNEVLAQSRPENEMFSPDKYELRIVGTDIQKINELAQQGFRLAVQPDYIAVMSRKKGETAPSSYSWFDWDSPDHEQQLAKLQEQGGILRAMYPSAGAKETIMIFEVPSVRDGKHREYKVLSVETQRSDNPAANRVEFELTPASKDTQRMINELAKEGFTVRYLFGCDSKGIRKTGLARVKILLERTN